MSNASGTGDHDIYTVRNDEQDNGVDVQGLFKGMVPAPAGLGIIKALATLVGVIEKKGHTTLKFDAGLPDHARPKEVNGELGDYAALTHADYSRYPRKAGAISETEVLSNARQYHKDVMGIDSPESRLVLTEGSTPALNHLIRMQAMQKARDGKPLGEGCVLELFELSYPLYQSPAADVYMKTTHDIKLRTEIDVADGKPIQSRPWQLNRESLSQSFEKNREKVAVFAFCNPANPSGHKLSNSEMDFLADEVLKDFQIRSEQGIAPKLVLEDVAYITMMHDENDRPYTLVHALSRKIAAEQNKPAPDAQVLRDLYACKQTVLTVHSLSKAAGEAGDRVAYTEGHPDLVNALREVYTRDMLSYANSTLYAARGAFNAGKPDREVMQEYSRRVMAFEKGMNDAFFNVAAEDGVVLSKEQIQQAMPFPNHSSGSFFTVMNLKPLLGQEVDAVTIAQVQEYIGTIKDEGIRNSFGEVFKDGKITNEKDLSLYFMFKTLEHGGKAISSVPLSDGMICFSMGMTPLQDVEQAVEAASAFFTMDPVYHRAIAGTQGKPAPGSEVSAVYHIDTLGMAHQAARG